MKRNNKRPSLNYIAVAVASMILLSFFTPCAAADDDSGNDCITVTYSFETPSIEKIKLGDNWYDTVNMQDAAGYGRFGEPILPVKETKILLPQGKKARNVDIIPSEKILLGTNLMIEPSGQPVPLSETDSASLPVPDETIYSSENEFPGKEVTEIGTYSFRGYNILFLKLHPVQYIPKKGELYYYKNITVTVETVEDETSNPLFRGLEKDAYALENKLDTPYLPYSSTDPPHTSALSDNYDMLILTTDELKNGFVPLADAHNTTGVTTIVKTLTDVDGGTPEDIRAYINYTYLNDGIDYVLLGGDADVIPAKGLYVRSGSEIEENMPSDLYYACLDGDFDGNDNGIFGEPDDDVDLVAEVFVGRACVNNIAEVNNFVDKTIAYINARPQYIGRVLLVGEDLRPTIDAWGGDHMDELIGGSNHHGYTTVGIPSDYAIYTLYDRDWPGNDWPKEELIGSINNGLYIIDHLGHGSGNQVMKMYNSDVDALTNNVHCFVYSQACNAGNFDEHDCFAEHMTVKTDHAAFAAIMNTREGWADTDSTDGPSHRYNREFWDAIFGEDIKAIGRANQDSKEDNIYRIDDTSMRWCYYEITLFGDPALEIYDPTPQPVLKIENITGGFRIHALIKNTGNADASNVDWSISIKGGVLKLINKSFDDTLGPLEVDEEETVETNRPIFGLGRVNVTVTASLSGGLSVKDEVKGFVLGCIVIILPEEFPRFFDW